MKLSASSRWILAGWIVLVGGYILGGLILRPHSPALTTFGNMLQCLAPLLANAGLLLNAASPNWRKNTFWMLLALGCTMWLFGELFWVYFELILKQPVPNPFLGDVVVFLHIVPMFAALALQPHQRQTDRNLRYGLADFALLLSWWLFLYLFIVIPWQYVWRDDKIYGSSFIGLYLFENVVFVGSLATLCLRSRGKWRAIYAQLLAAAATYAFGASAVNVLINQDNYYTGSLYDVPLIVSFAWYGTAGFVAFRSSSESDWPTAPPQRDNPWPARLAVGAALSLPLFAIWSVLSSGVPEPVRQFRLAVTLGAMLPLNLMVFWRQHLVNRERLRLLHASQESLENLKRLQTQFVPAEKLASLGQLAAGAAHEINNPLAAILGYTDLLLGDQSLAGRPRGLADKIRAQALRTKALVTSLLSFARQVPAEKILLDINPLLASAIQLRSLDLRDKSVRIELQADGALPGVRGDPNQMLQVFFNIISNAVDAMEENGGGVLTVRTARERANALLEFSDTGPGIREPQRVFDPFYTTKPVGKGTGLGLSICYGIIQEHGGQISCYNRPEGGATFRIELPLLPAHFPQPVAAFLTASKTS